MLLNGLMVLASAGVCNISVKPALYIIRQKCMKYFSSHPIWRKFLRRFNLYLFLIGARLFPFLHTLSPISNATVLLLQFHAQVGNVKFDKRQEVKNLVWLTKSQSICRKTKYFFLFCRCRVSHLVMRKCFIIFYSKPFISHLLVITKVVFLHYLIMGYSVHTAPKFFWVGSVADVLHFNINLSPTRTILILIVLKLLRLVALQLQWVSEDLCVQVLFCITVSLFQDREFSEDAWTDNACPLGGDYHVYVMKPNQVLLQQHFVVLTQGQGT